MKKFGFLMLLIAFFVSSCSTSKVAKQNESTFKGDWTLDQVVNDQGQNVVVTQLLNHNTLECFEGSTWHMVANNNSGHYKLEGPSCPPNEFDFKWYMEEDGANTYFWFKRVTDDQKAKNVKSGYKMQVISLTESNAHFMQEVPFEGGKMALHYYFTKQ